MTTPTDALATALDDMTVPPQPERCEPMARAIRAALPDDAAVVTVESLATALTKTAVRRSMGDGIAEDEARWLIKAHKEAQR